MTKKIDIGKDRLLYIIKEEIEKHDRELNKKLQLYTAKLSQLREERSQKYLTEAETHAEEQEYIAELRVLDRVIEDLNHLTFDEEDSSNGQ